MKKVICLTLSCLTALALFTGCSGTMYTDYGYENGRGRKNSTYDWNGSGNVSTSPNGTVNGGVNRNARGGNNPHAKMGGSVEIGK